MIAKKDKTEKISQATQVLELIESEIALFHDLKKNAYAMIKINDKIVNLSIESRKFSDWISHIYWISYNKALNNNVLRDCLGTLRAKAYFESPCHSIFIRIGFHENSIYLDLANEHGQFVEINADGWKLIINPPIKFISIDSMRPLPIPKQGGDFNTLFTFINIPKKSQKLVMAWMLDCFIPNTPYPLLVLHGLQGSAKSTTQEFLRELIDPSESNLRGAPKKSEDLMVAAVNNYMISLNNISYLSPQQQDDLCCVSTGGGYSTRKLYTTSQEQTVDIKRPVILNGINEIVTAQDLIDRSIIIELPSISEEYRKTELEIKENFNNEKPKILGGMLDALVSVLQKLPHVRLAKKPRMADFANLGVALEKTLNWEADSFMQAYSSHQMEAKIAALEHCPIIMAVVEYVEEQGVYEGSYGHLYQKLTDRYKSRNSGWPQSAKGLAEAIKRQLPALRVLDIEVTFSSIRKKDGYHVLLKKVFENKVHHVHQVHSSNTNRFGDPSESRYVPSKYIPKFIR